MIVHWTAATAQAIPSPAMILYPLEQAGAIPSTMTGTRRFSGRQVARVSSMPTNLRTAWDGTLTPSRRAGQGSTRRAAPAPFASDPVPATPAAIPPKSLPAPEGFHGIPALAFRSRRAQSCSGCPVHEPLSGRHRETPRANAMRFQDLPWALTRRRATAGERRRHVPPRLLSRSSAGRRSPRPWLRSRSDGSPREHPAGGLLLRSEGIDPEWPPVDKTKTG